MANGYDSSPPVQPPSSAAKFGVFIVVVATLAAGAWFYVSRRDSSPSVADSAAATPTAQPAENASPAAPERPGVAPTPSPQPRTQAASRTRRTIPAVTDAPPTPAASPAPTPALAAEPPRQPPPPDPAPERAAPVTKPVAEPAGPIYDAATPDVTPPSLLTPIGIAPIRTNYVPGLATIEIIVGGDGSVQSVKAGKPPATVGETLEMTNWLSTAKSWQFGPAVRNSQPVKYRLVVPLSWLVSGRGIR